jgi:hypothetical protein
MHLRSFKKTKTLMADSTLVVSKINHQPSSDIIQNILAYSAGLKVMQTKEGVLICELMN